MASGLKGKARPLTASSGCCLLIELYSNYFTDQNSDFFVFDFFATELQKVRLTSLQALSHLLVNGFRICQCFALHRYRQGAQFEGQLNDVHGQRWQDCFILANQAPLSAMQTKADEHLHLEWTVLLEWPSGILSMGPVSLASCGKARFFCSDWLFMSL